VTAYAGTPLTLTKTLYTRQDTKKGPVLEAVQGAVKVGDELVVRVPVPVGRAPGAAVGRRRADERRANQ